MRASQLFLPYQKKWLADKSRLKIVEKSRRIGMTWTQAYEDVRDACPKKGGMDVWFSSADESAAREYIRYCDQWRQVLGVAGELMGEVIIDSERDVKAFSLNLANGRRINALTSNPKAFRSKGGKLVLDEFAFHEDQESMWKAARPIITWGYPARILSTYNGKGNRYFRMVEDSRRGNGWNLHTTTIEDAVNQGLADKIVGRELTEAERQEWLRQERETCGDEETWMQEYMCIPVDEATAWLTWEMLAACEHPQAGQPELYQQRVCFLGMDIARRRDLTVIYVVEKLGDVLWVREVVVMKNASFAAQEAELERLWRTYKIMRGCLDQTGLGEQMTERAKAKFGNQRIEGVLFTNLSKQALAMGLKQRYEDRLIRTPMDKIARDSLHSVRKAITAAGNPRFDADRGDMGHADHFWALGLAVHAAGEGIVPIEFEPFGQTGIAPQLDPYANPFGFDRY